jgi:hypothetical protein
MPFACAPLTCDLQRARSEIISFKVQVGPPQIAIHEGQTVLVSDPSGQINNLSDKGLYSGIM